MTNPLALCNNFKLVETAKKKVNDLGRGGVRKTPGAFARGSENFSERSPVATSPLPAIFGVERDTRIFQAVEYRYRVEVGDDLGLRYLTLSRIFFRQKSKVKT